MPLDDRVRRGMQRTTEGVELDAGLALTRLRGRQRAPSTRGRLADVVVVLLLVALAVILLPHLAAQLGTGPAQSSPTITASASAPGAGSIVGSYRSDLSSAGEPLASANLAGVWQISFLSDGTVPWAAPPGAGVAMVPPIDTYQASAGQLVLNLFSHDLCKGAGTGSYSWHRSADQLTLTVVSDPCAIRQALLTTAPWTPQ